MSADRLRAMLSEATPGPWGVHTKRLVEEARILGESPPLLVALCDGRRNLGYEADARLIALAPDAIALLADLTEAAQRAALVFPLEATGIQGLAKDNLLAVVARVHDLIAPLTGDSDA